jgi:UDPglucose 6-dehydrogenase
MRITMIGSGYVGLVSGVCFADFGNDVICVDKDVSKIEALQRGEIPIFEPGLEQLVADNVRAGRLSFTTEVEASVAASDVVFIAVGTPSRRGDGHADLSYVYAAAREIAQHVDGFTVIVTKPIHRPMSPWSPIPNSCVKALLSRTSSGRTASSSASTTTAPAVS